MGTFTTAHKVDTTFVLNEKQVNAIKGLIVGINEGAFPGSSGEGGPDIEWAWISDNIPAANARMNELIDVGFVWQHEWFSWNEGGGDYSLGLTDAGIAWAQKNLGMPDPGDQKALGTFTKNLTFTRKGIRPGKTFEAGVKTTSAWVNQTSYTPDEADAASEALNKAVEKGAMKTLSAQAFKAHITRRTQQV